MLDASSPTLYHVHRPLWKTRTNSQRSEAIYLFHASCTADSNLRIELISMRIKLRFTADHKFPMVFKSEKFAWIVIKKVSIRVFKPSKYRYCSMIQCNLLHKYSSSTVSKNTGKLSTTIQDNYAGLYADFWGALHLHSLVHTLVTYISSPTF